MSQDPSMNTAILHWVTQVAGGAGAAPTASADAPSGTQALAAPPAQDTAQSPTPVIPPGRKEGDYEWLKQALANVESPERKVKRLLQRIEELTGCEVHPDFVCKAEEVGDEGDADAEPEEKLLDNLEELSDMVEDINWATEFGLMQGPARVLKALARALPSPDATANGTDDENLVKDSTDVRRCLALVVAHSAQLNESIQHAYAQQHWEAVLLPLLANECRRSRSSGVTASLLHACSCLCRDNSANTLTFVQHGGLACLTDILRVEPAREGASAKVLVRALFFLSYLAQAGVSAEEVLRLTCEQIELRGASSADAAGDHREGGQSSVTSTSAPSAPIVTTTTTAGTENEASAAPAHSENEEVQRAAALLLLNAFHRAPEVVKKAVREFMPRRWEQWKSQVQRGDGHDYRAELLDAMEKAG